MKFGEAVRRATAEGPPLLAFNIVDPASAMGVARAAARMGQPVILQASARTVAFYGGRSLRHLVTDIASEAGTPCFLHLDHCSDEQLLRSAMDDGFDGLMADFSGRQPAENIERTAEWASRAHERGMVAEGEVSPIRGAEDGAADADGSTHSSAAACVEFVAATGVDLVGTDIGTVHGLYASEPSIDFGLMEELKGRLQAGFVVHGGSGLGAEVLARLASPPVAKLNISTDLKVAWYAGATPAGEGPVHEPLAGLRRASDAVMAMALDKYAAIGRSGR